MLELTLSLSDSFNDSDNSNGPRWDELSRIY